MPETNERRFKLNKKCFAATRALARGKEADPKWNYIHVSKLGVIATDRIALIRVSLPKQTNLPDSAQVFTPDIFDPIRPKTSDDLVTMPEGLEAKSTGTLAVPNFAAAIPDPSTQIASITVTAKHLIEALKAACEVTDHSRFLVRLRICGDSGKNQTLRIDAHRDEGEQEFTAAIMGTIYAGQNIPGDPNSTTAAPVPESIDERKLNLPMVEGRKFRNID